VSERPGASVRTAVRQVAMRDGAAEARDRMDALATEEPLEIRIAFARDLRGGRVPPGAAWPLTVTMRTPGADFDLAAGLLFGEGIVSAREDIVAISYCTDGEQRYNAVNVVLGDHVPFDADAPPRPFISTSSCGVCGKASIEAAMAPGCPAVASDVTVSAETLLAMPERLRQAQSVFDRTGGLHAAALFTADGDLVRLREDVGRHNALDKLVGAMVAAGRDPRDGFCCITSRASVEMVRKAVAAGITALVAVSAPTARAVDTARRAGLALAGFARRDDLVLYSDADRFGPLTLS
jgi:FdhD protein